MSRAEPKHGFFIVNFCLLPSLTRNPNSKSMASSTPPEGRREPFLDRLSKDAGTGFAIGAIGGSIWHYGKGFLRPETGSGRLSGGFQNMRMKAPLTAGSWARFTTVYCLVDSAMVRARKTEDPYNKIISSFVTGGLLACRRGLAAAAFSSLTFGLVGIFAEGAIILANNNKTMQKGVDLPDSTPMAAPKLLELERGGGEIARETEDSYSESFDSPSATLPSFQTL